MGSPFNADSSAKTRCHFVRDDNNAVLNAQYNPTTLQHSRSANYASVDSPGISYPLTQYVGGNAREFSVELFFYDRPFSGKIHAAREYLEALLPPEHNTESFTKPPTFTFAYGYFIKSCVLLQMEVVDEMLDEDGNEIVTRITLNMRQVGD